MLLEGCKQLVQVTRFENNGVGSRGNKFGFHLALLYR